MNCADIEILICDYVDGTLAPAEKAELELHLAGCPACAELARDSAAAVAFIERASTVEPPPDLITRILFEAPWSKGKARRKGARAWLAGILSPVLQPRFAMGMAMTILSLSMLLHYAPIRQVRLEDLQPKKVWANLEGRATRTWNRSVKFYENLKFVYQIQTTLREWRQQEAERQPAVQTDERKLPVKPVPGQGAVPGAKGSEQAPASNASGGSH
jgi:Putative zinc-finger